MKKILISLVSLLAATSAVMANENPAYVGVAYHVGEASLEGLPSANTLGAKISVGSYLAETVAIELNYIVGFGAEKVAEAGLNGEIKIKDIKSALFKKDFILDEQVRVFLLAGWSSENFDIGVENNFLGITEQTGTRNFHGVSFGGGAQFEILWGLAARLEYVRYETDVSRSHSGAARFNYSGLNLGLQWTF